MAYVIIRNPPRALGIDLTEDTGPVEGSYEAQAFSECFSPVSVKDDRCLHFPIPDSDFNYVLINSVYTVADRTRPDCKPWPQIASH